MPGPKNSSRHQMENCKTRYVGKSYVNYLKKFGQELKMDTLMNITELANTDISTMSCWSSAVLHFDNCWGSTGHCRCYTTFNKLPNQLNVHFLWVPTFTGKVYRFWLCIRYSSYYGSSVNCWLAKIVRHYWFNQSRFQTPNDTLDIMTRMKVRSQKIS